MTAPVPVDENGEELSENYAKELLIYAAKLAKIGRPYKSQLRKLEPYAAAFPEIAEDLKDFKELFPE